MHRCGFSRQLQRSQRLLARNRRIILQKLIQTVARFERIEQVFQRNPRAHEHWNSALNLWIAVCYDLAHVTPNTKHDSAERGEVAKWIAVRLGVGHSAGAGVQSAVRMNKLMEPVRLPGT